MLVLNNSLIVHEYANWDTRLVRLAEVVKLVWFFFKNSYANAVYQNSGGGDNKKTSTYTLHLNVAWLNVTPSNTSKYKIRSHSQGDISNINL